MILLPIEYQKIFLYGSLSLAGVTGAFILQGITAHALPAIQNTGVSSKDGTVYLSGEPAVATPSKAASEVTIANNGFSVIKGARITSLSGSSITVESDWDDNSLLWSVETSGATYIGISGEKIEATDLHIGDVISITGKLQSMSPRPTIDAQFVHLQRN